jgi:hypothetical protein
MGDVETVRHEHGKRGHRHPGRARA